MSLKLWESTRQAVACTAGLQEVPLSLLEVRGVAGNEATLVPGEKTGASSGQPGGSRRGPHNGWGRPSLFVLTGLSGRGHFETIRMHCSMLLWTWLHLGTEGHNPGQGPALV